MPLLNNALVIPAIANAFDSFLIFIMQLLRWCICLEFLLTCARSLLYSMSDRLPLVLELMKWGFVSEETMTRLVDIVVAGKQERRIAILDGYVVDLVAAIETNAFTISALAREEGSPGARRSIVRNAIMVMRVEKA